MKHNHNNKVHRTVRGKIIDMNKMRNMNSTVRAVGNAKLNARGDKLDNRGNIKRKSEDIVYDYYSKQQEGIRYVSLTDMNNPATPKTLEPSQENISFITPSDIRDKMNNSAGLDTPKNVSRKKPNRNLTDEE